MKQQNTQPAFGGHICFLVIIAVIACFHNSSLVCGELAEPPLLPFKDGGQIKIGQELLHMPADGAIPEMEVLLPKVTPDKNAARYYFAAINCYQELPSSFNIKDFGKPYDSTNTDLVAWLKNNETALCYLDMAAKLPAARWPFLYKAQDHPNISVPLYEELCYPHLKTIRLFVWLRCCLARRAVASGNLEEAINQLSLAFVISKHLQDGVTLYDWLFASAAEAIVAMGLEDVLADPRLTREQLVRLEKIVAQRRETLSSGIEGFLFREMSLKQLMDLCAEPNSGFTWSSSLLFADPDTLIGRKAFVATAPDDASKTDVFSIVFPDRTIRQQVTSFFGELRDRIIKPYYSHSLDAGNRSFWARHLSDWNLMRVPCIQVETLPQSQAIRRNHLVLAQLAVTLRIAALDSGKRPANLGELVPRFLKEIPLDEFTGKPLRYESVDGGWRVYSVGPDCKDDGGARVNWVQPDQVIFIEDCPTRKVNR